MPRSPLSPGTSAGGWPEGRDNATRAITAATVIPMVASFPLPLGTAAAAAAGLGERWRSICAAMILRIMPLCCLAGGLESPRMCPRCIGIRTFPRMSSQL